MSRAANKERGELSLPLEGAEFVLRPSREAIEAFEATTAKGLIELAQLASAGKMTTSDLAQVATECIRAGGRATGDTGSANAQLVRIAEMILDSDGGAVAAMRVVGAMLVLASTGGYSSAGELKAAATTTAKAGAAAAA